MADHYVALIHPPENDSAWGATFPDFPGCTSAGDSFENAYLNAVEALAGHVAAMLADGDAVPKPSTYDVIIAGETFAEDIREGAKVVLVKLIETAAPKERINVMIDRSVLRRVDEAARAEGVSRSAFLERAAATQLAQ